MFSELLMIKACNENALIIDILFSNFYPQNLKFIRFLRTFTTFMLYISLKASNYCPFFLLILHFRIQNETFNDFAIITSQLQLKML